MNSTLASTSALLMDHQIPFDLMIDIFCRLPVKTLMRFKSISKRVCSLIEDDPGFIKSHLKRCNESANTINLVITENLYDKFHHHVETRVHLAELDSIEHGSRVNFVHRATYPPSRLIGSCNGLLCFMHGSNKFEVWNMATREHSYIIMDSSNDDDSRSYYQYAGFGYDPIHDDYKVMKIKRCCQYDDDYHHNYFSYVPVIYSLKSRLWKIVPCRLKNFPDDSTLPVSTASGSLYWGVVLVVGGLLSGVLSFNITAIDLTTEIFHQVSLPDTLSIFNCIDPCPSIGALGGLLCVTKYERSYSHLWVRNEDGIWSSLFTISPGKGILGPTYPISYSKGGHKVLMKDEHGNLLWYDVVTKHRHHIHIHGMRWTNGIALQVYQETLVPPGGMKRL